MMIFKKAIPRRTFLKGMGAVVALPLLDGMIPAFAARAETAAHAPARLGIVYVPNGIIMEKWTPATEGAAFELTPILEPMAAFRDRLVVLSGLSQNRSSKPLPGETGTSDHSCAGATYLTAVHPKKSSGADLQAGISLDQIIAKDFGKHTQLASLELGLDPSDWLGGCEKGWSCAYTNTISWRTATTPIPMEDNPRVIFERLFGDANTTGPSERAALIRGDRSLLDFVNGEASSLLPRLGPRDRGKLEEYLDAVRDVERRIQLAEKQANQDLPTLLRPAGIPATFEEHAKLMFDLQVLAYQADLTRIITFMVGHELTGRTYPEIGVPDMHHPLSHHAGDPEKIAKVLQINIHHAKMFAYYLEKLRSTPDGDASLLDHVTILYGGGLSDGNMHVHKNLPTVLVVGNASRIKGGRHLRYPQDAEIPMSNLHLTLLDKLGIPVERFGDSTGKLDLLTV